MTVQTAIPRGVVYRCKVKELRSEAHDPDLIHTAHATAIFRNIK